MTTSFAIPVGIGSLGYFHINANIPLFGSNFSYSNPLSITLNSASYLNNEENSKTFHREFYTHHGAEEYYITNENFLNLISSLHIGGIAVPCTSIQNIEVYKNADNQKAQFFKELQNHIKKDGIEYRKKVLSTGKNFMEEGGKVFSNIKQERLRVLLSCIQKNATSSVEFLCQEGSRYYDHIGSQILNEAFQTVNSSAKTILSEYNMETPLEVKRITPQSFDEGHFVKASLMAFPEPVFLPGMSIPVEQGIVLQFGNALMKDGHLEENGVFAETLISVTSFSNALTSFNIMSPCPCMIMKQENDVVDLSVVVPPFTTAEIEKIGNDTFIKNREKIQSYIDEICSIIGSLPKNKQKTFLQYIEELSGALETYSLVSQPHFNELMNVIKEEKGTETYAKLNSVIQNLQIEGGGDMEAVTRKMFPRL